jgi:hypothetical protein
MPFQYILADLLAKNNGAVGALFLDDAGETVDYACTDASPMDMRLLGAYVGIYLRQLRRFLEPQAFGDLGVVHIESSELHVFAVPLEDGYFLVLAQRSPTLSGITRRHVGRAAKLLVHELFAN